VIPLALFRNNRTTGTARGVAVRTGVRAVHFRDVPMGAVFRFRRDDKAFVAKKVSDRACRVPGFAAPWDVAPDEVAHYPAPKAFPMYWDASVKDCWSYSAYAGDTPVCGLVWRWPTADEHHGMWYWLTPRESGFLPADLRVVAVLRHVERAVLGILRERLADARRDGATAHIIQMLGDAVDGLADP
jgi:hypothetical protein